MRLDEPEHMQLRRLFDHAFRPERIKQLDPYVEELAHRLIDAFIDEGRVRVGQGSSPIPLPLYVIGKQMGAPEEDMWQIKAWTDAWVQRLGLMQTRGGAHAGRPSRRSRPSTTSSRSSSGCASSPTTRC